MPNFVARRLSGLADPFLAELGAWAQTAFETPEFLSALTATTAAEAGAELVLIGVETGEGAPVAVFPFSLGREGSLTVVEAVGLGASDYFVPPAPGDRALCAEEAEALWAAVRRVLPPADIVRLRNVPRAANGRAHPLSAARFLKPMGHCATVLSLDDGYDVGAAGVARDGRRKLRKLAVFGQVEFFEARDAESRAELVEAMVAFRRARFAEMGRSDYLQRPGVEAFYRGLAADPEGIVRLMGLKVGGEVVAVIYGLLHKGTFTLIIPTMTAEERWQACSPGLVALYKAVEHAQAMGWRCFDFSVGAMHYKTRFGAEKVELFEVQRALRWRGLPPVLAARARSALRTLRLRNEGFEALISRLRRQPA